MNFFDICLRELFNFSQKYEKIYIWGTGKYGKTVFKECHKVGISVTGFITTRGGGFFEGLPVSNIEDVINSLKHGIGIILAMHSRNYDDKIEQIIKENREEVLIFSEKEYVFYIKKEVFPWLYSSALSYSADLNFDKSKIKNILVIRLDLLGDMIWTTPLLRELRRNFPRSHISVVVSASVWPILRYCPYIDEIFIFKKEPGFSSYTFFECIDLARDYCKRVLSSKPYDVVFLPRFIELDINLLLGIYCNARFRFGRLLNLKDCELHRKIEPFFTNLSVDTRGSHNVIRILNLIDLFGGSIRSKRMELWYSWKELSWANNILKNYKGSYLIGVGITASIPTRTWSLQNYIKLFNDVFKKYGNVRFVILGSKNAIDTDFSFDSRMCIDLIGKTNLLQVAAIMDRCSLYVGSDTGLMHYAAAYRKPIVEISAFHLDGDIDHESSPQRAGGWGSKSTVLMPEHGLDDCDGFCRKPYGHCINQISVEEVYNAIVHYLEL